MENIKISIEETGELCQVGKTLRFGNLGYEILFIGDSFKGRSYQDVVL